MANGSDVITRRFQHRKQHVLQRMDKSSKGNIDSDIVGLCNKINAMDDYFTTSSCSGRILLLKASEKKEPGLFLTVWHKNVDVASFKKSLAKILAKEKALVYFKLDPCILHVACKNLSKAVELLDKAKLAGWKKSGIMANSDKGIMLELMSTEKLDLPIAKDGKLLVSDAYLGLLLEEANNKLRKTKEKIKKLENML